MGRLSYDGVKESPIEIATIALVFCTPMYLASRNAEPIMADIQNIVHYSINGVLKILPLICEGDDSTSVPEEFSGYTSLRFRQGLDTGAYEELRNALNSIE